jgi:hypothetical protein
MTSSEPAYHGRVMSVNLMGFSLMPVAALPMGLGADHLGAPQTIALCGLAVTLFVVGVAHLVRSYRHIEIHQPTASLAAPSVPR